MGYKPMSDRMKGIAWPVTDAWKESLRNWLRDNKVRRKQLADDIGADPAAITQLLSESKPQWTSKYVPAICAYTKLPPPVIAFGDDRIEKVLDWAYTQMKADPRKFRRVLGKLNAMTAAARRAEKEADAAEHGLDAELPSDLNIVDDETT